MWRLLCDLFDLLRIFVAAILFLILLAILVEGYDEETQE
jgi:hypothetical protein